MFLSYYTYLCTHKQRLNVGHPLSSLNLPLSSLYLRHLKIVHDHPDDLCLFVVSDAHHVFVQRLSLRRPDNHRTDHQQLCQRIQPRLLAAGRGRSAAEVTVLHRSGHRREHAKHVVNFFFDRFSLKIENSDDDQHLGRRRQPEA